MRRAILIGIILVSLVSCGMRSEADAIVRFEERLSRIILEDDRGAFANVFVDEAPDIEALSELEFRFDNSPREIVASVNEGGVFRRRIFGTDAQSVASAIIESEQYEVSYDIKRTDSVTLVGIRYGAEFSDASAYVEFLAIDTGKGFRLLTVNLWGSQ